MLCIVQLLCVVVTVSASYLYYLTAILFIVVCGHTQLHWVARDGFVLVVTVAVVAAKSS